VLCCVVLCCVVLCCVAAMDTDEDQESQQHVGAEAAAVAALLESRKLSLRMEKVVFKTNHENVYRLVEEAESATAPRLCVAVTLAGPRREGMESGDLLVLEECQQIRASMKVSVHDVLENIQLLHQLWKWDKSTGEMAPFAAQESLGQFAAVHNKIQSSKDKDKSKAAVKEHRHPLCLTAGWPYLSAVSFLTPNEQTVVTVMNEYPTDTYVLLKDEKKGSMWTALNGKSIQTITF
jgi:hypothetical protein